MFTIQLITGLSVGFEYLDDEELGFIINIDLGILRITWYKDIEEFE